MKERYESRITELEEEVGGLTEEHDNTTQERDRLTRDRDTAVQRVKQLQTQLAESRVAQLQEQPQAEVVAPPVAPADTTQLVTSEVSIFEIRQSQICVGTGIFASILDRILDFSKQTKNKLQIVICA